MIADFLAFEGPAFLEVVIDPDAGVYPMVGPGATYAQMITGDFIASRDAPQCGGGHRRHVLAAVPRLRRWGLTAGFAIENRLQHSPFSERAGMTRKRLRSTA